MKTGQYTSQWLAKSMDIGDNAVPKPIAWLGESWQNPKGFWSDLWSSHQNIMDVPAKSTPFVRYDFFYELISRNRGRKNPAMIWHDPLNPSGVFWHELSFKELERQARETALAWQQAGVKPGQVLCILLHPGPLFLKYLAAGFIVGVTLSFVHPAGATWMKNQLDALKPDHIVTENIYLGIIRQWQEKVLITAPSKATDAKIRSHSYPAGQTAALIFDPMSETPFEPKPVTSDFLFMCAVRDGLIGLRLAPGDIFSAPGFDPGLTQPCFMMASLANGATYLHLEMSALEKDPLLLSRYPLKMLGITKQLRNILMANPVGKVKIWDGWFRDPAHSLDMDVWAHFVQILGLKTIPGCALVWNAALGGCILFSRRRMGLVVQNVLPMPGRAFCKVMPTQEDVPALDGYGLLSLGADLKKGADPENESDPQAYVTTTCMVAGIHLGDIFLRLYPPARQGVYYPVFLVQTLVRKVPGCRDAVVLDVPVTGKGNFFEFHLLIFSARIKPADAARIIGNLRQLITTELGNKFMPDHIQFFPLVPRRDVNNEVDRQWSGAQYLRGGLDLKAKDTLFLSISRLRALYI